MSDLDWQETDKVDGDSLHYTSCGLPNIYLVGGFKRHKTRFGEGVSISNVEGLHRAIGRGIVGGDGPITGAEIRFLRKEMKYTQEKLAALIKVSDQAVARWEKGEFEIPGSAEIVVRALYREHIGDAVKVRKLAEQLIRSMVKKAAGRQTFEPTRNGWHAHAA
jgi:putative transcriptional regulator